MQINVKRVYDNMEESDGYRVLVDRLWPRGMKKEDIIMDEWAKEIAPSSNLRKAFQHKSELFAEFREKYQEELMNDKSKQDKLKALLKIAETKNVTLLFAAKNREFNQAQVLRELLMNMAEDGSN
nr:DUF488 family protein [Paenibacillus bovis]